MKRSISEIGHDDDAAGNKKARLADLGSTVVTIGFESVPQDVLNAILDQFDNAKDIKSLGLVCSQLQNRSRTFWESTAASLVSLRKQPYKLHQKQFISQRVIDMKRQHGGIVPFKLLDFSDLDPSHQSTNKKEAADSDDESDSGQFNPIEVRFLPWDSTRFVLLSFKQLAVFSIHNATPIYQQKFEATALNKIVFCTKTRSIGALVNARGAKIFILNDENGHISLLHTINLHKKQKRNKIEPVKQSSSGRGQSVGRGKPAARPVVEEQDEHNGDDEEGNDDGENDEEDEEDNNEDDDEVPKFRQTGYHNFVTGDKYVTVSRLVNIEQYSTSTGKLVKTETFSEKNVQEQLHPNDRIPYMEFYTIALSPDGTKAYAWSTQHYFDGGPLYELDIETGNYRILFRADGCDYDQYPEIKFVNDGKFLQIESLGSNTSCWYVHANEPPYRVIGSYSEDCCGGTTVISPDASKCLFYNYGPVKVHTFARDPDQDEEDDTKEVALGDYTQSMMDVTVKWHPKDSSIFFCSSGDKLHVVQIKENTPEVTMTLDQPFSNSFWFLQDITYYEHDNSTNRRTGSSHVLLLFTDSDQHTIVWDLPLDLNKSNL